MKLYPTKFDLTWNNIVVYLILYNVKHTFKIETFEYNIVRYIVIYFRM